MESRRKKNCYRKDQEPVTCIKFSLLLITFHPEWYTFVWNAENVIWILCFVKDFCELCLEKFITIGSFKDFFLYECEFIWMYKWNVRHVK
jgi:hypothetical protein